jgi:trans-aconitate methyltransferase
VTEDRLLDLGCGTGTLTIPIKETEPRVEVVGLDADPEVLERDNLCGALPRIFEGAGLAAAAETGRLRTAFGTLAFYRAEQPGGPA